MMSIEITQCFCEWVNKVCSIRWANHFHIWLSVDLPKQFQDIIEKILGYLDLVLGCGKWSWFALALAISIRTAKAFVSPAWLWVLLLSTSFFLSSNQCWKSQNLTYDKGLWWNYAFLLCFWIHLVTHLQTFRQFKLP